MSEDLIQALSEAFSSFKSDKTLHEKNLCLRLDESSDQLRRNEAFRYKLPDSSPAFWENISCTWKAVQPDLEFSIPNQLVVSLSRFTRNLVAGVSRNQIQAFENEPEIRHLLHYLTSFSVLEDKNLYPVTRVLVQALSNIITLNEALASHLWDTYTSLSDDQNILARLLAHPDIRTVSATLVLILNTVHAEEKALTRLTTTNGQRIIVSILDRTEEWVSQETSDSDEEEAFTIAYRLFESLIRRNSTARLYETLSIEDEPVTPHQTTLLKVMDSYLTHLNNDTATRASRSCDYSFLTNSFSRLCAYLQDAIRRALGIESSLPSSADAYSKAPTEELGVETHLKELDLRLPKVSAAMILLSQCLTTICLRVQEDQDSRVEGRETGYDQVFAACQAKGFVESLVETLRLVDHFLPRIVFGKPAAAPGQATVPEESSTDTTGFSYLKRDLVRLLGVICHESRNIQDRIRDCGGIEVVMNLCVIDERNPYLREHALFALRNVLHQNSTNQAVVEAMKPVISQKMEHI